MARDRSGSWSWYATLAAPGIGVGELGLPSVYGVVGKSVEIHLDTCLLADEDGSGDTVDDYTWSVWCPGGGSLVGYVWSWTPSAAGTWPIVVRQYDSSGTQLGHASAIVTVVPDTTLSLTVATLGGSNTRTGRWIEPLADMAPGITWVGNEGVTTYDSIPTDAVSGWSAYLFMTDPDSPIFIDEEYDIPGWLASLQAWPDVVVIWFGTNRVITASDGTWQATADDEIDRVETMAADVLAAGVAAVVVAIPAPGNALQAAWTDDYGEAAYAEQYRWEVRHRYMQRAMSAAWSDIGTGGIFLANTSTEVDPAGGYPVDNALHPTWEDGGVDMARAFYAALVRVSYHVS